MDYRDALEFLMAGAVGVQVGTASFLDPFAIPKIIAGIEAYMQTNGVDRLEDITGTARGQNRTL